MYNFKVMSESQARCALVDNILSIFWNSEQRRLRAFWRLILQGIYLTMLVVALAVPVLIAAVLVFTMDASGALPETLSGPGVLGILLLLTAPLELLLRPVGVWLAGLFPDRRRFSDFGVHLNLNWWIDLAFGLALGAVLMGLVFTVELAAGWITVTGTLRSQFPELVPGLSMPSLPFGVGILLSLAFFVAVGIGEEFLSRGYHLKNLAEGLGFLKPTGSILLATLLSSLMFGMMHVLNPNTTVISVFNLFLAGIMLAMGYILTGELAIPIGLHITWNFFQGNVFGFPVSGVGAGATFVAIEQGGNDLITGGAFGPEAGLIGIAAMVLGSILTILWVRVRYGHAGLWKKLTVPDLRHHQREVANDQQAIKDDIEA
jgi:membrane protease YdiL (CAAX protease family)